MFTSLVVLLSLTGTLITLPRAQSSSLLLFRHSTGQLQASSPESYEIVEPERRLQVWRNPANVQLWTFAWCFDFQGLKELWRNLAGTAAGSNFGIVCSESCSEACVGPREQDCVGLLEHTEKTAIVGRKGRETDWSVRWWVSALAANTEYVLVEEVGCGQGLSVQTDSSQRIELCEFTEKRTECRGKIEVTGWSRVRLSHCRGQISMCIDNSQGTHCIRSLSELFQLGKALKQRVSPLLIGREVEWECISAGTPRVLQSFTVPRRLTSTHYARWILRRTMPSNGNHYYSFVNTHVDTTSLTLTVVRLDGSVWKPFVYFYKPYSGTADWTQLAYTSRVITLTPSDPVIIAKGGSLAGPYTVKVYDSYSQSYEYEISVIIACNDISGACFCPAGQFPNTSTASCSACPVGDTDCPDIPSLGCVPVTQGTTPALSTFNCDTCFPNTNFLSQRDGTCSSCGPSCTTCIGTGPTNCSGCSAGTTLGSSVCECNSGTYPTPSAPNCSTCDITCLSCVSSGANKCSACKSNASLVSAAPSSCVCNGGYSGSPNACVATACDVSCATCNGGSASNCQTCKSGAVLVGTPPCACQCDSGYYGVPASCASCDGTCLSCTGASSSQCSGCKANAALFNNINPGTCVCNSGFFPNTTSEDCAPCDATCLSCTGASSSQCSGCKANAALFNNVNPGTCVCNSGFFPNTTSEDCAPCDGTCLSCTGGTAILCSACVASIAQLSGGIPSSCVCSDGYYGTPPNCLGCDQTCSKCAAAGATQCTYCKSNAHLVSGSTNSCVCDSGFFPDTTSADCKACDGTCLSCSGDTVSLCTACKSNASLPSGASTGSCTCLDGFYPSLTSANCSVCDPTCQNCSGAGTAACTLCKANAELVSAISPGTCICSSGFSPNSDASNCVSCDSLCLLCSAPGPMDCTSCRPGMTLSGGVPSTCICSPGFYPSGVNCPPCDSTCLECSSGVSTACSACHSPAILTSTLGSCICDTGYFANPTSANCSICHTTCYACIGSTASHCLSCKERAELASSSPSACQCSSGSAPIPDAANCVQCDLTCQSCSTAEADKCLSCLANAMLRAASPSACLCNSGFYPSPNASNCQACAPVCRTCSSASDCLSCQSGAALQVNTCVCDVGYFTLLDASQCQVCSLNCDFCDLTGCSKCSVSHFLLDTHCVTECPAHYSALSSVCQPQPPVPSLSATSDNSLLISFDQNMTFSLLSDQDFSISVATATETAVEVTWSNPEVQDSQNLKVNLTFYETDLPANSTATLTFLSPTKLVSSLSVSITLLTVATQLHPFGTTDTSVLSSPAAVQATASVQSTVAASVVSSIVVGDPGALATFVGSLQLMSYIAMTKIELPTDLAGTLAALNMGSAFSLPFVGRLNTGENSQETEDFVQSYGIESTLFLVNVVTFLGTAAAILGSFVPIYLLSKVSHPSTAAYFARLLPSLKWGVPLRLWLPAYLDICIYSLLQVLNFSFSSPYLTFNFLLACFFALAVLITPIAMCAFLLKYSHLMKSRSDAVFNKKWGALFEELATSNPAANCHYLAYLLRRLAFALSLVLVKDKPAFTVLLSCSMSLASLVYWSSVHCFAESLDQLLAMVTESGVLGVYLVVSAFLLDLPRGLAIVLTQLGLWAARVTVYVNLAASVYRTLHTVWKVVRAYSMVQKRTMRNKSLL